MAAIVGVISDKLTIRDIDEKDLDILKAAAREQGTSLNRYVVGMLHEQARREHHRKLFATVAAQPRDLPPSDTVAEVRALRDEKDAQDADTARAPRS